MKKYLILTLIFTVFIFSAGNVSSQDTSQSDKYRLQQIENNKTTISAKIATSSAKQKTPTVSFVEGTVSSVSKPIVFVESETGTKVIHTSDSTKFYNLDQNGRKLIGLGDLKSGDKIYIIGLPLASTSGSARIVVRDQTKANKIVSQLGKIQDLTDKNFKLADLVRTDLTALTFTLNQETTFTNSKRQSLKLSDIANNDQIVVTAVLDEKSNLTTKAIFKVSPGE